jgi:spermidine synthase
MKGNLAGLRVKGAIVVTLLAIGVIKADRLTLLAEEDLFYPDTIVYSRSSPYQRIVVTRGRGGFQLLLNSNLQFNSVDEYRYHEALVHPAMSLVREPRRALVLGGGDGLALREIFRYQGIESVTLVDLDPDMTRLSERFPPLAELNGHAFSDPRLTVINRDAFIWIEEETGTFDVVIIDFPDPNTYALGKLYTTRFYKMLRQRLTADAMVAIQCTSPLIARKSFWCIIKTLEAAGFHVRPYQAAVPSFGVWGYALASAKPFDVPSRVMPGLRFLDDQSMAAMFVLSSDIGPVDVEVNRLDNQALVHYCEAEWKRIE